MKIENRGKLTFIKELSKNSTNTNVQTEEEYNEILKEWQIQGIIDTAPSKGKCICGQSIKNICIIKNKITNKLCEVGTDCAEKLMGQDYNKYFKTASLQKQNLTLVKFWQAEHEREALNEWELKFIADLSKRVNKAIKEYSTYKLSSKQEYTYYKIFNKLSLFPSTEGYSPMFKEFNLYETTPLKLKVLLDVEDPSKTTIHPIKYAYLVYKGIKEEKDFISYYKTSNYAYKKNYYEYSTINSNLKSEFNKLLYSLVQE